MSLSYKWTYYKRNQNPITEDYEQMKAMLISQQPNMGMLVTLFKFACTFTYSPIKMNVFIHNYIPCFQFAQHHLFPLHHKQGALMQNSTCVQKNHSIMAIYVTSNF